MVWWLPFIGPNLVIETEFHHMTANYACLQASETYKANLLKSKAGDGDSPAGVETHTDGVTSLMVAAVGGHMVGLTCSPEPTSPQRRDVKLLTVLTRRVRLVWT